MHTHLYTPESNYPAFGKLDFDYQKQIWQQSTIKGLRDWLTNEKRLGEVLIAA